MPARRHPRRGARRIEAELARTGVEPPAVATIHRVLPRSHLVALQPPRQQKAGKPFERELVKSQLGPDAAGVATSV